MEKFYMQDLQEKQNKKQSKIKKGLQKQVNFSVALSFVVAAFALFSIASFGIINGQKDTISYAAPASGFDVVIPDNTDTTVMQVVGLAGTGENQEGLSVPLYYANSISANNRVFCVEMRKKATDGATYSKGDIANDAGLLYILRNSAANGKSFTGYSGTYAEYVEVWATQAAIWLYLADKYPTEAVHKFYNKTDTDIPKVFGTEIPEGTRNAAENATKLAFIGGPISGISSAIDITGVTAKVKDLVAKAKTATGSASAELILNAGDQLSKTSDGKYYQTSLVTVTGNPANTLTSYDITSIKGIDGVKIVDESGKDLALKNIPAGKKFYVRIPASKVTEKTQSIQILVDGHFTIPAGVYYVSEGNQKLIDLDEDTDTDQKGIQFDIVGVPDTGMNAAQTIYFIGLIVLLCGIGIVYANTKPVESKQ